MPRGVSYGEDGYLYVLAGTKIIKYTTSGIKKTEFDTPFSNWYAYIDEAGYMYAVTGNNVIKVVGSASATDTTHIYLKMNTVLAGTEADPTAFTVTGATSNPTVTNAEISNGNLITLTLSAPLSGSDTNVKLNYAKTGTNDLTTSATSFVLYDFTGAGVTNSLPKDQVAPADLAGVAPTSASGQGKITGTTALMEYKLATEDDSHYFTCSSGETAVTTPATYSVRFAARTGYNASPAVSVTVPGYTAAPTGLAGVAPTFSGGNGKITGTTTAMEFKASIDDDSHYTSCSAGETVATPNTYSIRFTAKTGFNASSAVSVIVPEYSKSKSSDGGGSATVSPGSSDKTVVINGVEEKAGTETTKTVDGAKVITLSVDAVSLSKKMEEVLKDKKADKPNILEIPVSDGDKVSVALTGDIVKEMEKENFDIAVTKGDIQYVIPASQITIEKLADRLNVDADKLEKIEVEIKMNAVSDSVLKEYKEVAQKMQHELIVPPVEFEVVATATGTDGAKHEVNVDKFSNYVERIIEIPANLDPSKITTGIVFNADGTYSHVPTTVFKENGKYYARINSLTNSVYSVIYNHVTVDSVKGHWAEETINDMASRLVLVDYANFDADSAITRAEFADYIVRALGLYRDEDVESTFSDISESNSYKISIQKANEWGIISGYPDGSFKADKTITREEAMAMYARAMNVLSLEEERGNKLSQYKDKNDVSDWAEDSVNKVVNTGIFNGKGNGVLDPQGTLTQAEALTAVRNLLVKAELINE